MDNRNRWRKNQINRAREHFKDFRAEFKDHGDIQTLEWRNKSGSNEYHVHYIFDTKQKYMHISGDLGAACFHLTWEPTLGNMSLCINNPLYITSKIECATDCYVYPEEYVRADIEECYKNLAPNREDYPEDEDGQWRFKYDLEDFRDIIESFIGAHDFHEGFRSQNCDRLKELMDMDGEWYRNIHGRCIAPRVYLWLVGLQMAWEQVKEGT